MKKQSFPNTYNADETNANRTLSKNTTKSKHCLNREAIVLRDWNLYFLWKQKSAILFFLHIRGVPKKSADHKTHRITKIIKHLQTLLFLCVFSSIKKWTGTGFTQVFPSISWAQGKSIYICTGNLCRNTIQAWHN